VQYPKQLWDPINKVMDVLSSILDGPQDDSDADPAAGGAGGRRGAGGRADAAQRGRAAAASRRLGFVGDGPSVRVGKRAGGSSSNSILVKGLAWALLAIVTLYFLATFSEVFQEGAIGGGFRAGVGAYQDPLLKAGAKASLKKVKEADKLCDEAQKSEHDRNWQDVQVSHIARAHARTHTHTSTHAHTQ